LNKFVASRKQFPQYVESKLKVLASLLRVWEKAGRQTRIHMWPKENPDVDFADVHVTEIAAITIRTARH